MIIYCIVYNDYEGTFTCSLWSSRELAEAALRWTCDLYPASCRERLDIQEVELDSGGAP